MRIALLHYSSAPIIGGVEHLLQAHAEVFVQHGHSVRLVVGCGEQISPDVPVVQIPEMHSRHRRVEALKRELDQGVIPPDFESLRDELIGEIGTNIADADIVIAHNVCSLHKNLALTAAIHSLAARSPGSFVFWHHDFAWASERYVGEVRRGYPWELTRSVPEGTSVITVSECRRDEWCRESGMDRRLVRVIPCGIDLAAVLDLNVQVRDLLRMVGVTSGPLIVIPARVTRRKNIEMGIEVAAELRKTYPSVRVIITGPLGAHNNDNRTYFDELRALRAARSLEQEVFFCAERDIRLEHSSVMQLLRASDLVFLPSFEEGFGIPLLEAAAMRTPVACSDIPVFREVTGGLAHFFNPHGSAHEAVATIEQALSSIPSLTYRKIRGEFSWEAVYASHLHSIIQKPR